MCKWYALWVLTGKEADALRRIQAVERVQETLLPKAMLWLRKAGEWRQVEQLLFPGYVFLRCRMDAEVYHAIKGLPEVIGWLGKDTSLPTEVPAEDMARVAVLMGDAPDSVLSDIRINRRNRRGYGTITLQDREFRIPFNTYDKDHRQADVSPGDASPEEAEAE